MPQASDERRAKMAELFGGDGIDDAPVIRYLEKCGYRHTRKWQWRKPYGHTVTAEEGECISFLIEEWDWDGLDYVDQSPWQWWFALWPVRINEGGRVLGWVQRQWSIGSFRGYWVYRRTDFRCCICNAEALSAPGPGKPGKVYCPECCPGHKFEHDRGSPAGWSCDICGVEPSHEWLASRYDD